MGIIWIFWDETYMDQSHCMINVSISLSLQGNIQILRPSDLDKYAAHAWLLSPPCQPYTRQGCILFVLLSFLVLCFLFCLVFDFSIEISRPAERFSWCSSNFFHQAPWEYGKYDAASTNVICGECCWIWGFYLTVDPLSFIVMGFVIYSS